VDDVWPLLPKPHVRGFEAVARRVRGAMENLGAGSDAFGLIHADLGVDANLLFWRGQPRAIDFDELGLGYWVYDLAVALEHCREQRDYRSKRDALLVGYCGVRALPQEQTQYLDLFMAAVDVHLGLWTNAVVSLRPGGREAVHRRFERHLRLIERYLDVGSQDPLEPRRSS
jgi:Ser/Thr protein kinase RdoA (MazF antagonist)